jgi:hypothetical protein
MIRTVVVGTMLALSCMSNAPYAADLDTVGRHVANYDCPTVRHCVDGHCSWRKACWRGCPDLYSCWPLNGAYGPYGGAAYWGAYTSAGWR